VQLQKEQQQQLLNGRRSSSRTLPRMLQHQQSRQLLLLSSQQQPRVRAGWARRRLLQQTAAARAQQEQEQMVMTWQLMQQQRVTHNRVLTQVAQHLLQQQQQTQMTHILKLLLLLVVVVVVIRAKGASFEASAAARLLQTAPAGGAAGERYQMEGRVLHGRAAKLPLLHQQSLPSSCQGQRQTKQKRQSPPEVVTLLPLWARAIPRRRQQASLLHAAGVAADSATQVGRMTSYLSLGLRAGKAAAARRREAAASAPVHQVSLLTMLPWRSCSAAAAPRAVQQQMLPPRSPSSPRTYPSVSSRRSQQLSVRRLRQ
jgi:hypothetical protein